MKNIHKQSNLMMSQAVFSPLSLSRNLKSRKLSGPTALLITIAIGTHALAVMTLLSLSLHLPKNNIPTSITTTTCKLQASLVFDFTQAKAALTLRPKKYLCS